LNLPFTLSDVSKVVAYKRDELTTDLICFDVITDAGSDIETWTFHEEQPEFEKVVGELAALPGFLDEWRERVVLPRFSPCETTIYSRPIA
jgi:hypothetical protein